MISQELLTKKMLTKVMEKMFDRKQNIHVGQHSMLVKRHLSGMLTL